MLPRSANGGKSVGENISQISFYQKNIANLLINSKKKSVLITFYAKKHKKGRKPTKIGTSILQISTFFSKSLFVFLRLHYKSFAKFFSRSISPEVIFFSEDDDKDSSYSSKNKIPSLSKQAHESALR